MGGGAEILVCEVTIRSDRNGEITQKNNYVYLIVQISYSQFSNFVFIFGSPVCENF